MSNVIAQRALLPVLVSAILAVSSQAAMASPGERSTIIQGDLDGLAADWGNAGSVYNDQFVSQSFEATSSVNLTSVLIGVRWYNPGVQPVAPLLIQIFATAYLDTDPETPAMRYQPVGAALTYVVLAVTAVPNGMTAVSAIEVILPSPIALEAGSHYAIVLSSTTGNSSAFGWIEKSAPPAGIDDPSSSHDQGAMWQADFPAYYFAAYGEPRVAPTTALATPRDLLQQVGRQTDIPCSSFDDSALNWAGASSGGWVESWAEWVNTGKGGSVCTRWLYWTPSGRWAVRH